MIEQLFELGRRAAQIEDKQAKNLFRNFVFGVLLLRFSDRLKFEWLKSGNTRQEIVHSGARVRYEGTDPPLTMRIPLFRLSSTTSAWFALKFLAETTAVAPDEEDAPSEGPSLDPDVLWRELRAIIDPEDAEKTLDLLYLSRPQREEILDRISRQTAA